MNPLQSRSGCPMTLFYFLDCYSIAVLELLVQSSGRRLLLYHIDWQGNPRETCYWRYSLPWLEVEDALNIQHSHVDTLLYAVFVVVKQQFSLPRCCSQQLSCPSKLTQVLVGEYTQLDNTICNTILFIQYIAPSPGNAYWMLQYARSWGSNTYCQINIIHGCCCNMYW